MLNSSVLDVTIGLLFIFLLYSLLATTIQEILATVLALRARLLKKAIDRMLTDDKTSFKEKLWIGRLIAQFWLKIKKTTVFFFPFLAKYIKCPQTFSNELYNEPAIKYLGLSYWFKKPSYIDPKSFSRAILTILEDKGEGNSQLEKIKDILNKGKFQVGNTEIEIEPDTKKYLLTLLYEAKEDLDKFRTLIEDWFNETMDRLSGWYKRKTQLTIFLIGLGIAVTFNVDTISITNKLSKDKKAQEQMVKMASSYIESHPLKTGNKEIPTEEKAYIAHMDSLVNAADSIIKKDIKDVNNLMALGWNGYNNQKVWYKKTAYVISQSTQPKKLLGFLVTALALSMGAPFWFDLLSKLIQLRGAGNKPKSENPNQPVG